LAEANEAPMKPIFFAVPAEFRAWFETPGYTDRRLRAGAHDTTSDAPDQIGITDMKRKYRQLEGRLLP
jgi:hypothetical protein